MRSFITISLFLLLATLSPIRSDSSEESEESKERESDHDQLNRIEDGGYDGGLFVAYDYSQGQAGEIDTVLHLDLSITELAGDGDYPALDYDEVRDGLEEFDWSMLSSSEEVEGDDIGAVVSSVDRDEATEVDYDYDKSTEISSNVIVGLGEDLLDLEIAEIDREYQYVDNYDRIEEALQVTMDNVYDQAMIFHIILLLGICLICLVVFFALVALVVTILARRQEVATNPVRTIKIKSDGIVKSYAKIPVEIKNMVPSNIAYKPLYDV